MSHELHPRIREVVLGLQDQSQSLEPAFPG
jgi:hypothetical protein